MSLSKSGNLSELLGENIATRRKQIGLTQESLAEKLSISSAALSRIESGQTSPRFNRLEDLALIFGCQVADLFREKSRTLGVRLDTIEDMLRPLPGNVQEELIHLLVVAIQMVKKQNGQCHAEKVALTQQGGKESCKQGMTAGTGGF